ncbi:MAG: putative membrane protein [Bacteroidia bacterium]|jgi:uncharacterized membrane protein
MEQGLLHAHSWLRWVLLLLAVFSIAGSLLGWFGKKSYNQSHNRLGLFLTISADIQLLLGLVIYFVTSALTKLAFQDFGAAMKSPELRFYAVEHILVMIIAIVLLHIGKSKVKKADTDLKKHKTTVIYYGIALVLILSRVPWDAHRLRF